MDTNTNNANADTTPRMFQRPEELAHLMPHYEESTAVDQAVRNAMALMEQFASSAASYEQQQQQPPPVTTSSTSTTTTGSSTQHNNNKGDPDNPWNNPDQIYQQLDQARHEISQAWEKLHAVNQRDQQQQQHGAGVVDGPLRTSSICSGAEDETAPKLEQEEQQNILRMAYMDMITDAFADVLEDLRQRQESSSDTNKDNKDNDTMDVETLVDCLQNGLDLLISSSNSNNNNDNGLSWSSFNENDFAFGGDTTQSEENAATDGDDDNKSNDDVKLTPHESRRRQLGYLLVDQLSETKVI